MDDAYFPHKELERPDWSQFYPGAKEELPSDMPEALGRPLQQTMFVDASHAANVVTRQSRTGVLRASLMRAEKSTANDITRHEKNVSTTF